MIYWIVHLLNSNLLNNKIFSLCREILSNNSLLKLLICFQTWIWEGRIRARTFMLLVQLLCSDNQRPTQAHLGSHNSNQASNNHSKTTLDSSKICLQIWVWPTKVSKTNSKITNLIYLALVLCHPKLSNKQKSPSIHSVEATSNSKILLNSNKQAICSAS